MRTIGMEYKTEIFNNLIPEDSLAVIKALVDQSAASLSEDEIFRADHGDYYRVGEDAFNLIANMLPLMPNEVCSSLTLLKHKRPTGPHTDTNISDEDLVSDPKKFARTFIIPLETQETNTITFNEKMPHGTSGNGMYQFISDLPVLNSLSPELIQEHFGNMEVDSWVKKLSIETIFPWIAGDVLALARSRIHTGDNHLGKAQKKGIIVWTETN